MRTTLMMAAVLALSLAAQADTILVPHDYPAIQWAINESNPGDTILVSPGTYFEQIAFMGKAITVRSAEGPVATIIDGRNPPYPTLGSVVYFVLGEGLDSVLDGFTITNGEGTFVNSVDYGGGIYCDGTSPTIQNNIIAGNKARTYLGQGMGGGIFCSGDSPLITGNTVMDNESVRGGGILCTGDRAQVLNNEVHHNLCYSNGGGIWCSGESPEVAGNRVHDNSAENIPGSGGGGISCTGHKPTVRYNLVYQNDSGNGGGIYCSGKTPVITCNVIYGNQATYYGLAGYGGGIFCGSDPLLDVFPVITNNLIYGNSALESGGGIFLGPYLYPKEGTGGFLTVTNNTIVKNTAWKGGGIALWDMTPAVVTNTILWGNTASSAGDQGYLHNYTDMSISHSLVEDGQAGFEVLNAVLTWGSGMLDQDPGFVDEANDDYHLLYPSPCRDGGDSHAPFLPEEDFEGDPRIDYSGVDMGADEFSLHLYSAGSAVPGGKAKVTVIGTPGVTQVAMIIGLTLLDPPIHSDYGLWHLADPFVLISPLPTIPPGGGWHFMGYIPAMPVGPYDIYLQAIVDYTLSNLCILEVR